MHRLSRRGAVREVRQVKLDQGTDSFQRSLGIRHEILVAQAHRPLGAELIADPFRSQILDHPAYGRLPHRVTFVVPHDAGLEIFLKGLSKGRYHPPPVTYQVDYVQVYPGYHPEGERTDRRFARVYDDGFFAYRTYGSEKRERQSSVGPEPGRRSALLVQQA